MRLGPISLLTMLAFACKGPAGLDGKNGANGIDGADGQDGATGPAGADGADGAGGADGADGANGADGADGQDGSNGIDGMDAHFGTGPWGVHLTFVDLVGGTGADGQIEPGDYLSVVFKVEDDLGIPYDLKELTGVTFMMSGPTTHEQILFSNSTLASIKDLSTWDATDYTWTYDFPVPVPATFAPPPNDATDIGAVEGDWGGQPLVDGTYTLAGYAYLAWDDNGENWDESSNATMDVLLGAATTITPHEVVKSENCYACHGDNLYAHGGSRTQVEVCVTCHVRGGEDRYSQTDPSITPGATISMDSMIHGIHMGLDRPSPLVLEGYPADPNGIGYPNYNEHDWGYVGFPNWPDGVMNCDACHGGAAQGDVENRPSAQACEGCHSDIDVRSPTGGHPLGLSFADDTMCTSCHPSLTSTVHVDARKDPALNPGLNVDLKSVTGMSGPNGEIEPGDVLTLHFTATHDDGSPIDMTPYNSTTNPTGFLSGSDVVLAGPSDHWQQVLYDSSKVSNTTAVYDPVAQEFTYTFSLVGGVPATTRPSSTTRPTSGSRTGTGTASRSRPAATGCP
jgi:hypothetical protein